MQMDKGRAGHGRTGKGRFRAMHGRVGLKQVGLHYDASHMCRHFNSSSYRLLP